MSIDDLIDDKEKKKKEEITDPKLKRLMSRRSSAEARKSRDPPNIEFVKKLVHRPHKTVKMVVDGVEQKPQNEVINVYKCNKCEQTFNHTQYQEAMGVLPMCPKCDK